MTKRPRVRQLLLLGAVALALATAGCGVTASSSSQELAPPPVSVNIAPSSTTLQTGSTQQFTATVGGTSNTAVTWLATGGIVSNTGLYTAPSNAGTFAVTATSVADGSKSASATVTVTAPPPVVTVSINPTSASLNTGGTQQFTATVTGTSNTAVTWSATGGTISNTGLYTAPSNAGTFAVTAISVADGSKSASATVTVTAPPPVIAISVSPTSAALLTGGTQQFAATVTGSSNTAVTWSATGGSVSTNGLYTAPGTAGTFTVRATSVADTSKSATATITVTAPPPVVAVSISPTSASLLTGGNQQFTATVTGTSNTAVTWSATGGTISNSGLYTAPSTVGTFTVRATSVADNSKSASVTVTVTLVSVSINPTSVSLLTGGTQQFTATVTGSNNTAVTWSATGGTISTSGFYTAPATAGTFTVTATSVADTTKSASATTTVTQVSVNLSPTSASLLTGGTQQFTATVTGTSNTAVSWSATGGTISSGGLYTAPGVAGTFTVRAISVADNSKSASATVAVTAPPPVVAVSISPTSAALQTSGTQQFTATVTGTSNTAVTWSATGGTISTSGFYTAPATAGTFLVTATSVADSSKSASATVTVTLVAVSISPTSASLLTGGNQQFTATVTGASNTAVTWSATAGTISSSGLYTAPGTAGTFTITATSVADASKSASATVTVAQVSVGVSPTSASLLTGGTQQFTATVSGPSNTAVTWSATGGTISTSGLYTAPGTAGTFTVRATSVADATKSASATVTVTQVSVAVSPSSTSLLSGGSQQFTATVTGSSNTAVNWSATAGTISSSGLYTAPGTAGTFTITATSVADASKSASATVTVTIVSVSISPVSASVQTGGTQQFTATVTGSSNTAVTWSATGGSILASGLYTAPGTAGTFTVRATSVADASKSATATITVTAPPPVVAVSISPTSASLLTGGTQQFTATVTGTSNTAVAWSATGGSISTTGLYTAPATAGTFTVTATSVADASKSASATVTVTLVSVSISPTSASLLTGGTQQFTATVTGTSNTAVAWSSTGGSISTTGLYTAPATAGTFTVTATSVADASKSASATVTVTLVSVSISPTSASLLTGGTQQFTATVTGTSNTAVTWSATGGTVSTNGLYTASGAAGTFTVRATSVADASKSATATVTVTAPPPVVTVSISPTSASLLTGGTQQFTATVTGSSNIAVTWSATGGTISTGGLYTAPGTAGTSTITATSVADATKSASATVTVTAVSVSISPVSASLLTGSTQQFTATVTGTSNTAVTWSTTGGTVSANGLYTAPGTAGTFTVRATSAADISKSASATVTVTTPPAAIAVSPTSVTFSSIPATTTSSQAIVVTNTGGSNLTVSQANLTGATVFTVTAPAFPFTLSAGQSGSVTIQFAPQATGTFSGSLALISNASNTLAAIPLSGTATAPPTFLLSISPTSLSFGNILVGNTSTQMATLTNTGNSSVTVFSASTTGTGFSVTGPAFPVTLAAGATRSVSIRFAPQAGGTVTGTASFTSSASNSPTTISLTGAGTTPVQHSVDLTWNASTSLVAGYNIYRGLQSGGPYTKLNTVLQVSTAYTDSSVQSGLTYFYVVTAVNAVAIESVNSNETVAVIPSP